MPNIGCTACDVGRKATNLHPLLNVPMCAKCYEEYHSGDFSVDEEGDEIYCRWCGEGSGELLQCDFCIKCFCTGCVKRNFDVFGDSDVVGLDNGRKWKCFLCNPNIISTVAKDRGWVHRTMRKNAPKAPEGYIFCQDISNGRERKPIPCINTVDDEPAPIADFTYVKNHVPGTNVTLSNNPNHRTCCSCVDNCRDHTKCECMKLTGGLPAYSSDGTLKLDKPSGIYECNDRCACHRKLCRNRVVGGGIELPLEVFRCADVDKGWGVRCRDKIPAGTYVADYIGEVILETAAERRGLSRGDEYLFALDYWGRSQACQSLADLGMKAERTTVRTWNLSRELDVDISLLSREDIINIFVKGQIADASGEVVVMPTVVTDESANERDAIKWLLQHSVEGPRVIRALSRNGTGPADKMEGEECSISSGISGEAEALAVLLTQSALGIVSGDSLVQDDKSSIDRQTDMTNNDFSVGQYSSVNGFNSLLSDGDSGNGDGLVDTSPDTTSSSSSYATGCEDSFTAMPFVSNTASRSPASVHTAKRSYMSTVSPGRLKKFRHDADVNMLRQIEMNKVSQMGDDSDDDCMFLENGPNCPVERPNGVDHKSSLTIANSDSNGRYHNREGWCWLDANWRARLDRWKDAQAHATDVSILEVESKNHTYCVDARWYGSLGRFFNHSCSPNIEISSVFVESHDLRVPRVAFFANQDIPANTEICYDYGYYDGNVQEKHRECLCGSDRCRGTLY